MPRRNREALALGPATGNLSWVWQQALPRWGLRNFRNFRNRFLAFRPIPLSEYSHGATATTGGDKMRLGMFLTTLVGLAGASYISSAADATWVAVGKLENGASPYCAGGQFPGPEWTAQAAGQVDIKGNTLTYTSASQAPNRSFTLDLKALQPDGSGKVVGKDDKNREFYLTFDPGSGARPFHMTYRLKACRRVYTPTT